MTELVIVMVTEQLSVVPSGALMSKVQTFADGVIVQPAQLECVYAQVIGQLSL